MAPSNVHERDRRAWRLANRQHEIVTRGELLELGFSVDAIRHRVHSGRLHPKAPGVYKVGGPGLTREGRWMVAVKSCGPHAALSHLSAAALWGIRGPGTGRIHVSVPVSTNPRRRGVAVHRPRAFEVTVHDGIPVTTVVCTLTDLATMLRRDRLEAAINQADILGLTNPEQLRKALDTVGRRPGAATLRRVLDIRTFRFTRSGLERAFIPIALRAGLPRPLTRQIVNGEEVDFYWPELRLVVETDGLTYHRTPAQQAKDAKRDQKHVASGLIVLRFPHGQIRYEHGEVEAVLRKVASGSPARTPGLPRAA